MGYNATKIKTYQPILPIGNGPVCENPSDALYEIFQDLRETSEIEYQKCKDEDLSKVLEMLALIVSDWIDGEYTILEDYKLVIKHYTRTQLDEMQDFQGY